MVFECNLGKVEITTLPNECPFCHKSITPHVLYGFAKSEYYLEVLMLCPNESCLSTFIAYYRSGAGNLYFSYHDGLSIGNTKAKEFSEIINEVSPTFVKIYGQANTAEQYNLLEVCGVGYRKALEFLIKDYAVLSHTSQKEQIEKKFLSACISEFVNDQRIQAVAKRAVWLGNDETHYIRKWEGKNLNDLKLLIDLTVHWIEMERLSKKFEDDMPEK
jgi:hypothetical protein